MPFTVKLAVLSPHPEAPDCQFRGLTWRKKQDYTKGILNLLPKRIHAFVMEIGEVGPKQKLCVTIGSRIKVQAKSQTGCCVGQELRLRQL